MFTSLSTILENWASIYTPIAHDQSAGSKHKAFYRVRTINDQSEFMRNQHTASTPCMAYSVLVDAEADGSSTVNYAHTIYFLSRANSSLSTTGKQSEMATEDAQVAMDGYAQDLLAYLQKLRHTGICPVTGARYDAPTVAALRGLDLDKAQWASSPAKYGEWHILGLQIEQVTPRLLCVNMDKYNKQQ